MIRIIHITLYGLIDCPKICIIINIQEVPYIIMIGNRIFSFIFITPILRVCSILDRYFSFIDKLNICIDNIYFLLNIFFMNVYGYVIKAPFIDIPNNKEKKIDSSDTYTTSYNYHLKELLNI